MGILNNVPVPPPARNHAADGSIPLPVATRLTQPCLALLLSLASPPPSVSAAG